MIHEPVRDFKKGNGDLGSPGLPSRQEAFLSGVLLALCQQSPAMYAFLRDAEVAQDGACWLVFFKLPPDVVRNMAQVINVEKKQAYEFQQHGVLFTAFKLEPNDEEMENLSRIYHDKEEEPQQPKKKPDQKDIEGADEQENSTVDRLAATNKP